jgi:uncharacterized repeat protein (TIGR01451 family)
MKTRRLAVAFTLSIGLLLTTLLLGGGMPAAARSDNHPPLVALIGGDLTLVSVAPDGTPGNGTSSTPSVSASGRYVAFASNATNLIGGDTNGAKDVFVHDRQTGTTTRVSLASDGSQANGDSFSPSISGDGRYVAFASSATNLVLGDGNDSVDIFVHDRETGQTTRVSVASDGTGANSNSYQPSISSSGQYVAFESAATNLIPADNNGCSDIFVRDRQTNETTRVSTASDGTPGDEPSYAPSISADGQYVAFESASTTLVSGDTNGCSDVFVRDRQTNVTTRVSVSSGGAQGDDASSWAAISGDGRYVAFESFATNLVSGDTNSYADIFVHDRQTGETRRASVPDCGGQGSGPSDERPAVSGDGRYVAFRSAAPNLVGEDAGYVDIFARDGTLHQTAFVSAVPGVERLEEDTCWPATSDDGRYVAFQTGDCLWGGQVYVRDRGDMLPPDTPAQLLHVSTGGSDEPGCGDTSGPCRTVQHAVNQASCGATVRIASGIYSDTHTWAGHDYTSTQVVHLNKGITLSGGYTPTNWSTPDPALYPTTLDAGRLGQVIVVGDVPTVTLEGLRVANGWAAENGAGVGVRSEAAHVTVRDCEILSNTTYLPDPYSYVSGGGLYVWGGVLLVEDSQFISNTAATDGGGIYVRNAVVTLTHNLFQENVSRDGGGAWLYESTSYVADNTFHANRARDWAGGLFVGWGNIELTRNEFLNNTASDHGGGLYAYLDAGEAHTVTHNLFQSNVANPNGSGTGGAARLFGRDGGQMTFAHNRVVGNYAATGETGANGGRGGGVFVLGPALISGNLFESNWASSGAPQDGYYYGGYGGGLYLMGSGLQVEGNRIVGNYAARNAGINYTSEARGGGVHVASNAVVTMTNNVIAGNRFCDECTVFSGPYRGGGGISIGGATMPTMTRLALYHNTIADNQSPAVFNESAGISVSHSIFSGHDVDVRAILDSSGGSLVPPAIAADYTLWWPAMNAEIVSGTFSHTHSFTGTPDFVSTAHDDYHLGSASQAIDRGAGTGVTYDIDAHPRPILSGYDLGADEYTGIDLAPSAKYATPHSAEAGEVVTFTIALRNAGNEDAPGSTLFDAIPLHTIYVPSSAQATAGTVTDGDGIGWTGLVPSGGAVTITFQVTLSEEVIIRNTALVTDTYGTTYSLVARVNSARVYLPLVVRE